MPLPVTIPTAAGFCQVAVPSPGTVVKILLAASLIPEKRKAPCVRNAIDCTVAAADIHLTQPVPPLNASIMFALLAALVD